MLDGDKNHGETFKAQKENRESCWGWVDENLIEKFSQTNSQIFILTA